MFEKPRLGTFSRCLAPSIDNSQASVYPPGSNYLFFLSSVSSLKRALSSPLLSSSALRFMRNSPLLFPARWLCLFSRHIWMRVSHRRDTHTHTRTHQPGHTRMYRERKLTITGPPRAFIAHLGGVHTTAILLATIKYWCKNGFPEWKDISFVESVDGNLGR